ncbi:MAG: hypothetical protein NT004_08470 [Bacteroidetes bacterium]|nr:hypothetical protein [Bacteroidota bacterium]
MKKIIFASIIWGASLASVFAIDYPAWFIYPQRYPKFITGFSYKGNPPVTDAEVMYCVYKHCDVEGYIETFSNNSLNYLKNVQYHYVYPESDLKWIEDKLFYHDRFILSVASQDYVETFSLSKDVEFEKIILSPESIPVPVWLQQTTWEDAGYYYGVGMVTSLGNPSECWKNSEEQAIYNILTSISIKFFALNRLVQDTKLHIDELTTYTRTDLKFYLSSIQTMERYPDLQHELYYTLVRIHKTNVTPLLFDLETKYDSLFQLK